MDTLEKGTGLTAVGLKAFISKTLERRDRQAAALRATDAELAIYQERLERLEKQTASK